MNKITRRQKKEAVSLVRSRHMSGDVVHKFLGWMLQAASEEANGGRARTVGKEFTEFVKAVEGEVRACKLCEK